MITVTEFATDQFRKILADNPEEGKMIRIFVQGGGRDGFKYGIRREKIELFEDHSFEINGIKFVVDIVSISYIRGVKIDFIDSITGGGFTINNSDTNSTCNC